MRRQHIGRHWTWPKAWWRYFDALGWHGCDNWAHNITWRDA